MYCVSLPSASLDDCRIARVHEVERTCVAPLHSEFTGAAELLFVGGGRDQGAEEAGPLSAQHKKIKRLVKERAAQHERDEQLFTKNSVIAIFRFEDQTCGLKSQIWNS